MAYMPRMQRIVGKRKAHELRKNGASINKIAQKLKIAVSTAAAWCRDAQITTELTQNLTRSNHDAWRENRKKALLKKARIQKQKTLNADVFARKTMPVSLSAETRWLVLTALYLGEGFKNRSYIGFANSNEKILKLFLACLNGCVKIDLKKIKARLYLRMDQLPEVEEYFWRKALNINGITFNKPSFDKRTLGKKTSRNYHGVCALVYYDADIGRKIAAAQKLLLQKMRI